MLIRELIDLLQQLEHDSSSDTSVQFVLRPYSIDYEIVSHLSVNDVYLDIEDVCKIDLQISSPEIQKLIKTIIQDYSVLLTRLKYNQ